MSRLRDRITAVRGDGERGSATLELAIITPALLLLLGLIVMAGRVDLAAGTVEHAAASAAREATLARDPGSAVAAARGAAAADLAAQGVTCASSSVDVDAAGFSAGLGEPATVTVTVSCTVPLSDLAVPGLPGSRTMTASATSSLDRYRSR